MYFGPHAAELWPKNDFGTHKQTDRQTNTETPSVTL